MITWDSICKAVEPMKTVNIKGKEYATVPERIKAFRQVCPGGSIATDIVKLTDDMVVMKATVADEDGKILGTGMAFEMRDSSYINKTSFIENCETSAVGRALGMVALGVDASMASAEELVNAIKGQEVIKAREDAETAKQSRAKTLKEWIARHGMSMESFGNWRNAAVDNKVIPDRRINDLTDAEFTGLLRFVELNCDAGQA
jgi:hypothetical protein